MCGMWVLNNKIGIFSQNSNSTINNNYVCGNIQYDFYSTDWGSSHGDNNTCDKTDGWNDTSASNGCRYLCKEVCGDISITNVAFTQPIGGYIFNVNVSIHSTLNTSAELTIKVDGKLTESRTIDLSEGMNYEIFTLIAKGRLHNVSLYVFPLQTCDNNLSNNEYNTTYNGSTPKILVKRILNNLNKTNETLNITFIGNLTEIMHSPREYNFSNYSKSLKGFGTKDIGTGKVVITYKGSISVNVISGGNGEISIFTPSAASSNRQSRNVTVKLKDNGNTITGNCENLPQCTFIYDKYNTETIKLDFNNLTQGQHTLEYEVNITTNIYNLNYTIHSLSKSDNNLYLQNDSLTQWTDEIKSMAENLTQICSSDFEKVGRISRWIHENINYNENLAGQPYNASWVFNHKQGVCVHYTNLFIAMCRSIGIPARGVYGDIYNISNYLGGHAWAEVFIGGEWYAIDPTFNEIGFIDSAHVTEGYNLSTLKSTYFSVWWKNLDPNSIGFNIYYPDLHVLNTTSTSNLTPIVNITPKWKAINVSGNNVTYEITGIFDNSRGQGYIIGNTYLWHPGNLMSDYNHQLYVGQNKANASWRFNISLQNLNLGTDYELPLTVSNDPTPKTSISFNAYTNATFEIYDVNVPNTIQKGTTTQVSVTIRNIGVRDGNTTVKFYVNNTKETERNLHVPGVSGINTTQFTLNTALLSLGNHTLKFVAGNDIVTKTITIIQQNCTSFDLDGNQEIEIYDVVAGLEHLSEGKNISNEECTAGNNQSITLFDLLTMISRIVSGQI